MTSAGLRTVAVLIAVALTGWLVIGNVDVRSDLSFVFPEEISERTRFLTERLADPSAQGTYLLAIEGGDPEGRASLSMRLTRRLADAGEFSRVANGAGASLPAGFDHIFENRYLLGPPWEAASEFSADAIAGSLQRNMVLLATSPGQVLGRYLPADPVGRGQEVLAALAPVAPAVDRGVWVSPDGARTLIVARAKAESFDLDRQAGLLADIEKYFNELRNGENYRLLVAGPPAFAVAIRDRIQGNVGILTAVSVFLVLLLAWGGFRRPRLFLLLGLPLGIGVLAGLATVQVAFGFVHGITLAFGASLVGIAIDYPLHVLAHAAGHGVTRRAAHAIWPTLGLSAATSIAAFMPFMLADFPGLAQIGLFVATGLAAALLSARYLFPILCPSASTVPLSDRFVAGLLGRIALLRWPLIVLTGAAVLTVGVKWPSLWETDLRALSPAPSDMVKLDREIRSGLGAPDVRYLVTVRGGTVDEVLLRQEALRPSLQEWRERGWLGGWSLAADLLPSAAEQRRRQATLPDPAELRSRIERAVEGTAFRAEAFDPFIEAVKNTKAALPVTLESLAAAGAGDLLESRLTSSADGVTGIVALSGLAEPERTGAAVLELGIEGVGFVDLKRETDDLVRSFLGSSLSWLGASLLAVLVFLFVGLRRPVLVGRVLAPVLMSLGITLGVLAALDIPVSLFHILSLILVAGLGMDYGLFFARHGGEGPVTFRATILCNLTTASVFLVMAFASIPVLHGIGLTVAVGSFVALVANAAFARPVE